MKPDQATIERVQQAIEKARQAGETAAEQFRQSARCDIHGRVIGPCGYAFIETNPVNTPVTGALLKLGIVRPKRGAPNYHVMLQFSFCTQSIDMDEEAAKAAARVLTEELGQKFSVRSCLD